MNEYLNMYDPFLGRYLGKGNKAQFACLRVKGLIAKV